MSTTTVATSASRAQVAAATKDIDHTHFYPTRPILLYTADADTYTMAVASVTKNFDDSLVTADTITITGHGFGTTAKKVYLKFTTLTGTPPTGLVSGTAYLFTITSAAILTLSGIGTDASADFTGTLTNAFQEGIDPAGHFYADIEVVPTSTDATGNFYVYLYNDYTDTYNLFVKQALVTATTNVYRLATGGRKFKVKHVDTTTAVTYTYTLV